MERPTWNAITRNLQLILGIAISITATFFVSILGAVGVVIVWIIVGTVVGAVYFLREKGFWEARKPTPKTIETSKEPRIACDPGPHQLEGGEILHLTLDVRMGDHIKGRIQEVDGDDFDWYIVDEENLIAYLNREEFEYADGNDHVAATTVDWVVDEEGPWFLVLDLYRRYNTRIIEIDLRVR